MSYRRILMFAIGPVTVVVGVCQSCAEATDTALDGPAVRSQALGVVVDRLRAAWGTQP